MIVLDVKADCEDSMEISISGSKEDIFPYCKLKASFVCISDIFGYFIQSMKTYLKNQLW